MRDGSEIGHFKTRAHEQDINTVSDSNSTSTLGVMLQTITNEQTDRAHRDLIRCLGEGKTSCVEAMTNEFVNAIVENGSSDTANAEPSTEMSSEEADWTKEPLKSVSLKELIAERTPEEVAKLKHILWKYRHILSNGELDFKSQPKPPHSNTCRIDTTIADPVIQSANRSASPEDRDLFKKITEQKIEEGVIEKSYAPWSSNALIVKKDGKLRMVIDYRSLNKITVRDAYPMPKIQDLMDCLKGTKWFTGVDCVQAFHQIPMADERSRDLTTFRGPTGGLFRYRYMPMGLINAMAIWSRFIDTAMEDHLHQRVLCYADDCLIFTKSENVDDHVDDIEKVFKQFERFGIKIKASKLMLGRKTMPFLGIVITENGMEPNPEKTKAIMGLQEPTTLKQLRRVLGIFAYYRKFIPKFSLHAAPLYELTKAEGRRAKNKITMTEKAKQSFAFLRQAICNEPCILHYPDWDEPFEIHTDASTEGIAAILSQKIDGKERVIMYASRGLTAIEKRYQIYEQECLAVVWAAELFRKYIRNRKTIVMSDCAALQWLKTRKEGARVFRWILRLQEFDLEIRHRKGVMIPHVDGLTRERAGEETEYRDDQQIETLYTNLQKDTRKKEGMVMAVDHEECVIFGPNDREIDVLPVCKDKEKKSDEKKKADKASLKKDEEKKSDEKKAGEVPFKTSRYQGPTIEDSKPSSTTSQLKSFWTSAKDSFTTPQADAAPPLNDNDDDGPVRSQDNPFFDCEKEKNGTTRQIWIDEQTRDKSKQMEHVRSKIGKEAEHGMKFDFDDGLIVMTRTGSEGPRLVVPETLKAYVLMMHHNVATAGHQGKNRTVKQLALGFYWPKMKEDAARWVRACLACRRRKTPRPKNAGIRTVKHASYPNETVAMDILGPFMLSTGGNIWVLTMIDHFTRWPVAIPIAARTSEIIANAILKYWICEKGVPATVVSDQGRELISKGIQQMCRKMGIMKVSTSGYSPTGNATVERFHRYLNASLCILFDRKQPNWDDYIPPILFSYRTAVNESTGFSPFKLETGRDPILPAHVAFPFLHESRADEESYVKQIQESLTFAFQRAQMLQQEMSRKNQERMAQNQYDPDFKVGDLLLVWEKSNAEGRLEGDHRRLHGDEGGKLPGKLRNPWQGPYKMIGWKNDRNCIIDRDGKHEVYNVTRLIKHTVWDANHPDTSGIMDERERKRRISHAKAPAAKETKKGTPQPGEIIIFRYLMVANHRMPVGIGEILEVEPSGIIKFQWRGNVYYKHNSTFKRGWFNKYDEAGSYGRRGPRDVEWTNTHSADYFKDEDLIARGKDLLTEDERLNSKARKLIAECFGREDWWFEDE